MFCKTDMSISENLTSFYSDLKNTNAKLVAVTKTKPIELIQEAYDFGHRIFGENKVQELVDKQQVLPSDIEWHMIGHLQRNKVKYIAPFVSLIHGVDTFKLLKEIDKQGLKHDRVISCLLQIHIAQEETKFGFDADQVQELLSSEEFTSLKNIKVLGLMGMATYTEDKDKVRDEFATLKKLFNSLHTNFPGLELTEISIGMSGDYKIALEEGSTLIRVGSAIFGARNKQL